MNSRLQPAPAGGCLAAACLSLVWICSNADSQTLAPPVTPAAAACEVTEGAVVRGPKEGRRLALVFTGHEFAEGGRDDPRRAGEAPSQGILLPDG